MELGLPCTHGDIEAARGCYWWSNEVLDTLVSHMKDTITTYITHTETHLRTWSANFNHRIVKMHLHIQKRVWSSTVCFLWHIKIGVHS